MYYIGDSQHGFRKGISVKIYITAATPDYFRSDWNR